MAYLIGIIIGQTVVVVYLLAKIKFMVNEIKRYQYTNNLKLIGYLEKRLNKSVKYKGE